MSKCPIHNHWQACKWHQQSPQSHGLCACLSAPCRYVRYTLQCMPYSLQLAPFTLTAVSCTHKACTCMRQHHVETAWRSWMLETLVKRGFMWRAISFERGAAWTCVHGMRAFPEPRSVTIISVLLNHFSGAQDSRMRIRFDVWKGQSYHLCHSLNETGDYIKTFSLHDIYWFISNLHWYHYT